MLILECSSYIFYSATIPKPQRIKRFLAPIYSLPFSTSLSSPSPCSFTTPAASSSSPLLSSHSHFSITMRTSIHLQTSPPHLLSPPVASPSLTQDSQKLLCAQHAASLVKPSTILGLGTGSTASLFLEQLSDLLSAGSLHSIVGVPTSLKTDALAKTLNIPLTDLGSHPVLDLSVDGADEVDQELNLVKGRGGSLLREKMVEGASREFVVIVDETKLVPRLGTTGPIPVEVIPFGWDYTIMKLKELFKGEIGFDAKLRTVWDAKEGKEVPFKTDNENYIVNLLFEKGISGDLRIISDEILRITGVIEHGIFIGMATSVIVAKKDGKIEILNKK
ncbi:hypothetical protein LUZ61_015204 [Rhynchospora tenuis]|uniref:ribose-5-phosphate isomerase n=1 Tax=Rhynchospora tenuis TaxID=198213 RepID=A0AAD5WCN9_9POAL|nr:hypothetical protein LUZ61_015204 [Rhynchospora tenuis]